MTTDATPRWPVVVLDFDGTVGDTIALIVESFRHATSTVVGIVEPVEVIVRGIGRTLEERMAEVDPDRVAELCAAYTPYLEARLTDRVQAYPGIPALLDALSAAGVRLAVATTRRRSQADPALRVLGLRDHLEVLVGHEDVERHKPHPAPLLAVLDRLGEPAHRAVYVGDAVVDVEAARAAGLAVVAVTWGAGERRALEAARPDHLVDDADALARLLLG